MSISDSFPRKCCYLRNFVHMEVLLKYASYLTTKGITTFLWLYEGVKIRIFCDFFKRTQFLMNICSLKMMWQMKSYCKFSKFVNSRFRIVISFLNIILWTFRSRPQLSKIAKIAICGNFSPFSRNSKAPSWRSNYIHYIGLYGPG